ncbi:MAG TPA: amidase [Candidatus Caenarcaniphilales bacterium]|nr:amidase [Candidatus Caenarcaniphilales bacterium]
MRFAARRLLGVATTVSLFLVLLLVGAPVGLAKDDVSTDLAGIDVDATTIPEFQALMNEGTLTSEQLTQFYLDRISSLDRKLKSVITVSPTALDDARAADEARQTGDNRPLLGIPIMIKDNINTTGMATTAGSWALAESTPPDAFIVKQLRSAGALILGKANLSEWANFRSIPSSSGWSGIGGQTNFPYVLDRNPCGSSSGSAVVVTASLAVAAVGTETDGSIVCPAGANSVVGIKPTLGLLSREGIIPISADQDTAGPIARNVTDAAVLLGAMTGADPADPATAAQEGNAHTDYTESLDSGALDGARIGVWRKGTFGIDPKVDRIMERAIAALEEAGAVIVDPTNLAIDEAYEPEFTALLCEFKDDIRDYLEAYTGPGYPKNLRELIEFNDAHPKLEGPWNSEIFVLSRETGGRDDPQCIEARETANRIALEAMNETMADNDLDAIIAPTNGPAWVTDPVNGDLGGDFSKFVGSSTPPAITGYPSITVPAGFAGRSPIGITFMAGRWDEPELIGFAYDFEQATHARRAPQFIAAMPDTATASATRASDDTTSGNLLLLAGAVAFVVTMRLVRPREDVVRH